MNSCSTSYRLYPRLIRKDGIHLFNIRYWDGVLGPWAGRLEKALLVKYDPRNLSRVYVRDPNGRHWSIPYADLRQPSIALWELEEASRHLRKNGSHSQTEQAIFENVLEQRCLVTKAGSLTKQRRRREKMPVEAKSDVRISPKNHATNAALVDVKPYPVEIWEGE